MSFLNPVNEPVLRFKSTDAGAPQINYNNRVAGDVKAVLKACLVTGYGSKASAGWSVVNEVNHVAEFVSPSVAMSDYRLGIDDTSASSTTWYYQYQDARTNPTYRTPTKDFANANKTHANNGWQLLVTTLGFYFIEHTAINTSGDVAARLTYFGQTKSALSVADTRNISFWYSGWYGSQNTPNGTFDAAGTYLHYRVGGRWAVAFSASNILAMQQDRTIWSNIASSIDLSSDVFLIAETEIVGQQSGLLTLSKNNPNDLFGVRDTEIDGRPLLVVPLIWLSSTPSQQKEYAKHCMVRLDYWEY